LVGRVLGRGRPRGGIQGHLRPWGGGLFLMSEVPLYRYRARRAQLKTFSDAAVREEACKVISDQPKREQRESSLLTTYWSETRSTVYAGAARASAGQRHGCQGECVRGAASPDRRRRVTLPP